MSEAAHPDANIIFGAMVDEKLEEQVWVTVVATGYEEKRGARPTGRARLEEPRASHECSARGEPGTRVVANAAGPRRGRFGDPGVHAQGIRVGVPHRARDARSGFQGGSSTCVSVPDRARVRGAPCPVARSDPATRVRLRQSEEDLLQEEAQDTQGAQAEVEAGMRVRRCWGLVPTTWGALGRYTCNSVKPAAGESPSNASASIARCSRMVAKLVASTHENSLSSR